MIRRSQHSISTVLMVAYMAVGVVGHLNVLNRFFSFNDIPSQISQAKQSPTRDGRVYWTQQRHIPSNVRVEVPAAAVVELPVIHQDLRLESFVEEVHISTILHQHSTPTPPRAPPLS